MTKTLGRVARNKTSQEAGEEADALTEFKLKEKLSVGLRTFVVSTLVSGVATAVRNNISQVLRSGVDTKTCVWF